MFFYLKNHYQVSYYLPKEDTLEPNIEDQSKSDDDDDSMNETNKSETIINKPCENDGSDESLVQSDDFNTQIIDLSNDSIPVNVKDQSQNKADENDSHEDSIVQTQGFNTQIIDSDNSDYESNNQDETTNEMNQIDQSKKDSYDCKIDDKNFSHDNINGFASTSYDTEAINDDLS